MDIRETLDDDIDPLESFDSARASVAAAQRRLLSAIVECERAGVWRTDGCRDMAQWLSCRMGISNWAARRWAAAAHSLERLPLVSAAMEAGSVSVDKVLELCRFATRDSEQELIDWAQRVSPATVRRRADVATGRDIQDVKEADRARFLRGWWYEDGLNYGLEGCFTADQGVVIQRALARLSERVPEGPEDLVYENGSPVCYEARMERRGADALFMMASQEIAHDKDPDRATVVVHAPLDALSGGDKGCAIERGPVIHPEVAARLSCDARLQVVLHDRKGDPLGIGWTGRNPPPWLMRALRHRDERCTFPGCDLRRFTHAHHITKWPLGPTTLRNLVLVCPFHHKLVHEHQWKVELSKPGAVTWFRPNGRRFDPSVARL